MSSNRDTLRQRQQKTFALRWAIRLLAKSLVGGGLRSFVLAIHTAKTRYVLDGHRPSTSEHCAIQSKPIQLKPQGNWRQTFILHKAQSFVNFTNLVRAADEVKKSCMNLMKGKKIGENLTVNGSYTNLDVAACAEFSHVTRSGLYTTTEKLVTNG